MVMSALELLQLSSQGRRLPGVQVLLVLQERASAVKQRGVDLPPPPPEATPPAPPAAARGRQSRASHRSSQGGRLRDRSYSSEGSRSNRSQQLRENLNKGRGRNQGRASTPMSENRRSRTPSPGQLPARRSGFGAPPPDVRNYPYRFALPPGLGQGVCPPETNIKVPPGEAARLRLMRHPATRNMVPVEYERLLANEKVKRQGAGDGARSVADRLKQNSDRHSEILGSQGADAPLEG